MQNKKYFGENISIFSFVFLIVCIIWFSMFFIDQKITKTRKINTNITNYHTKVIDSCEYLIISNNLITHKGNCTNLIHINDLNKFITEDDGVLYLRFKK